MHQVKAGAAFSALVNTLVIALVALLPGASLGTTVLILSAAGLSSTAGLVIVLWRAARETGQPGRDHHARGPARAVRPCSWLTASD